MFPIGRLRSALRVGAPSNSLRQPICVLVAGIQYQPPTTRYWCRLWGRGDGQLWASSYAVGADTRILVRSEHKTMKMVYGGCNLEYRN